MDERATVILNGVHHLELTLVQRGPDGTIIAGRVMNGFWDMEIRSGEVLTKAIPGREEYSVERAGNDPDRIVSRFPFISLEEVEERHDLV